MSEAQEAQGQCGNRTFRKLCRSWCRSRLSRWLIARLVRLTRNVRLPELTRRLSGYALGKVNFIWTVGRLLAEMGEYDAAVSRCTAAKDMFAKLGMTRDTANCWLSICHTHSLHNNLDAAIDAVTEAIRFQPSADKFAARAYCHVSMHNFFDADADISAGELIDEKDQSLFITKAWRAIHLGKPQQAIWELEKARERGVLRPEPQLWLSLLNRESESVITELVRRLSGVYRIRLFERELQVLWPSLPEELSRSCLAAISSEISQREVPITGEFRTRVLSERLQPAMGCLVSPPLI